MRTNKVNTKNHYWTMSQRQDGRLWVSWSMVPLTLAHLLPLDIELSGCIGERYPGEGWRPSPNPLFQPRGGGVRIFLWGANKNSRHYGLHNAKVRRVLAA